MLLEKDPLPLVVLTPKSLLRHPLLASTPRELAEGRWQPVIDDAEVRSDSVRRLIFCSGKVYVDLVTAPERQRIQDVAVCRVEQVYPFPEDDLRETFARYSACKEVVWLQEEPRNMGVWEYVRLQLARLIDGRCPLHYIGRPRSSSPAEGSSGRYALNQEMLVKQAFTPKGTQAEESVLLKNG